MVPEPPVLAYPNVTRPFMLHMDASGHCLGAMLEQESEEEENRPTSGYLSGHLAEVCTWD